MTKKPVIDLSSASISLFIRLGVVSGSPRDPVIIDGIKMIDSRMLLVATSGAGKSYLIRVFCEQAVGVVPTIILDREGEFASLRERHDVVLIGEDGEADASLATAAKLARVIVELGVSVVINLYNLSKADKRKFVRIFLDALMSLPRSLWRPMFVVVDEAHEFCPEAGREAESRESVIRLMDSGRKRGICGILCTQRYSKLSKDAAAEAANVCIGRITLDNDLRRASDTLGFTGKSEWATLRGLDDGEWFGFGPAFNHRGVVRFKGAEAKTTHPKAGERHKLKPPAPSKAILKVAPELAALKQKVADEASELDALRTEVKQLRASAKRPAAIAAAPPSAPKIDTSAYVLQGREDVCRMMHSDLAVVAEKIAAAKQAIAVVEKTMNDALHTLHATRPKPAQLAKAVATAAKQAAAPSPKANGRDARPLPEPQAKRSAVRAPRPPRTNGVAELGAGGPRRILSVLAQHPDGLETGALRMFAQIGSMHSLRTYIGRLITDQCVVRDGKSVRITETGFNTLGDYEELPRGQALVDHWLAWCGNGGPRKILQVALDAGEDGVAKDDLCEQAEIGSMHSLRTYIGRLQTAKLVESFRSEGQSRVRAVAALREAARA